MRAQYYYFDLSLMIILVIPGAHGHRGVQADLVRVDGGTHGDTLGLRDTGLRPLGVRLTEIWFNITNN